MKILLTIKNYAYLYLAAFIVLLFLPQPFEGYLFLIPGYFFELSDFFITLWDPLVTWIGKFIFNTEITILPEGSGDTTWNYVQLFVITVLAFIFTSIVILINSTRQLNIKWEPYFLIFVRYTLALAMLSYGWQKVFYLQFSDPVLASLNRPLGEMHPMSLLWNFMGYSKAYTIFTGIMEVLAGLFLLFRSTTTLGALTTFGVMIQVVALNFSYSVPVKIFSTSLLLLSVILLYEDRMLLINAFLRRKVTTSTSKVNPFKIKSTGKYYRLALFFKVLLIISVVGVDSYNSYLATKQYGNAMAKPSLYGHYKVKEFSLNDSILPSLTTDSLRWKSMTIDTYYSGFNTMTNKWTTFNYNTDSLLNSLSIINNTNSSEKGKFIIKHRDSVSLKLEGIWVKDTLKIEFLKKRRKDYPLLKKKFEWIIETPNS